MKNFIQPGKNIDVTVTEAVAGGSLITIGDLVGVAVVDSPADDTDVFAIATEGVYAVNKAGVALNQGDAVEVPDAAASNNVNVIAATGSGIRVGVVVVAAKAGDATAQVKLNA